MPLHTLRSQRTTCRISLSPFTMKVPGAELKSSSLVASPLNLSAILWTLAAVGLKEPELRAAAGGGDLKGRHSPILQQPKFPSETSTQVKLDSWLNQRKEVQSEPV